MSGKQRNLLATAPLLKKGGVNLSETPKAITKKDRKKTKIDLRKNPEVYFI